MTDETQSTSTQTQTTAEAAGRSQSNITWKGNGKAVFQAALDTWAQTAPKGAGTGDFILDMIDRLARGEGERQDQKRFEALGIDALVDMHRRRQEADGRMLEQIADLITDAQARAREEVATEIAALKKSLDLATKTVEQERGRAEQAEVKAAELTKTLETTEAKAADLEADLGKKAAALEESITRSSQLEAKTTAIESDLDKAKTDLDKSRTEALEAKTERDKAALDLDSARAALQAATDHEKLIRSELDAARARIVTLETAAAEKDASLENERKAAVKIKADLDQAKIDRAGLEAKAKAQTETIAALREAIAAMTRPQEKSAKTDEAKNMDHSTRT